MLLYVLLGFFDSLVCSGLGKICVWTNGRTARGHSFGKTIPLENTKQIFVIGIGTAKRKNRIPL